jgi:hypothetical protein
VPAPAPRRSASEIPNEEAKQPPLYYWMAGVIVRLTASSASPARALLVLRLFDVLLAAIAIFGPLRLLFRGSPRLAVAGLVALLTPGAAEAFARCSNDASVLLWSAVVLAALDRRVSTAWVVPLVAAGPLLKLTAIPVVVFAAAALWLERRRAAAVCGAAASLLVLPVQALRGWATGGAAELPRGAPAISESAAGWLVGLARTAWTLLKATPWAMGWSLLRPPAAILAAYLALLAAAAILARVRPDLRRAPAHAAAALAVGAGTIVFAVALRRYFGVWGGVTGWYVWNWSAWLAVAARDLLDVPPRRAVALLAAEAAVVATANAVWMAQAAAAYGR